MSENHETPKVLRPSWVPVCRVDGCETGVLNDGDACMLHLREQLYRKSPRTQTVLAPSSPPAEAEPAKCPAVDVQPGPPCGDPATWRDEDGGPYCAGHKYLAAISSDAKGRILRSAYVLATVAAEGEPAGEDIAEVLGDGTERLCRALYSRSAHSRDYLGGAEAKMLYDAASRISELTAERDAQKERADREMQTRISQGNSLISQRDEFATENERLTTERDEWLADEKRRYAETMCRLADLLDVWVGETVTDAARRKLASLAAAEERIKVLEGQNEQLLIEVRMQRARTASLEHGDEPCASVLVPIPDHVWPGVWNFDPTHPEYGLDDEGRRCLGLDVHIVPAIRALWNAGIVTRSCCCGHGNGWGVITVASDCGSEVKQLELGSGASQPTEGREG